MSVEAMRAKAHHSYRARLEVIIRIPTAVSDHDIHEMIKVGFPTYSLESLLEYCRASLLDCSSFISPVIPDVNISRGERLSENDRCLSRRVACDPKLTVVKGRSRPKGASRKCPNR